MVVHLTDVARAADTESQGSALLAVVTAALKRNDVVIISFAGADTATSSFVNAAFIPLLALMDFDEVKRRVRVIESTRQINDMIKRRMTLEAQKHTVAA